jgi:methylated-DNA-[protein]-cysteine S-methyltransferase
MEIYTTFNAPVGVIYIRCSSRYLTGLWFEGQAHFPNLTAMNAGSNSVSNMVKLWLSDYFSGKAPDPFSLPLKPKGTAFQQSVWEQLLYIPYGNTCTYKQIAQALGIPKASQAVGNAVGKNPISIIIPCHRVVGSNGALTGYAGGLEIKQKLLFLEQSKE